MRFGSRRPSTRGAERQRQAGAAQCKCRGNAEGSQRCLESTGELTLLPKRPGVAQEEAGVAARVGPQDRPVFGHELLERRHAQRDLA
jgi:hypothetical protein